jgi:quinol monooxygenase YgiN
VYAIFGAINVKREHVVGFREATIHEARGTVRDEPGVFQFHILTDADTPNRFYYFEIFRDEAAGAARHSCSPFLLPNSWVRTPRELRRPRR